MNLDGLARILKISKQTVQQHIRSAENKLIPYLVKNS